MINSNIKKIAVISDIHANFSALAALNSQINSGEHKVDAVWFLGDLFGYGSDVNQVYDCLKNLVDPEIWLLGNHDLAIMGNQELYMMMDEKTRTNTDRHRTIVRKDIVNKLKKNKANFRLSKKLPIMLSHGIPGKTREDSTILYENQVASRNDISAIRIRDEYTPEVPVWIIGHSHLQTAWLYRAKNKLWEKIIPDFGQPLDGSKVFDVNLNGKGKIIREFSMKYSELSLQDLLILNPGSIGKPRDGNLNNIEGKRIAKYMQITFFEDKFEVNFKFVPYT